MGEASGKRTTGPLASLAGLLAVSVSIVLAGFLVASAVGGSRAGSGERGLIVFTKDKADSSGFLFPNEIDVIRPDGSGQRRLTHSGFLNDAPAWSPDGKRIAYFSASNSGGGIFVMNADGSQQRSLTRGRNLATDPAWSPDGKKIAFILQRGGSENHPKYEIDLINADGSGLRKLTPDVSPATPSWAPDGKTIAFEIRPEIYAMAADGSGQRRLTSTPGGKSNGSLAWSPDGRRIAFVSDRDGSSTASNLGIYVMAADGSGQRRLTSKQACAFRTPVWSPDGKRLAFQGMVDYGHQVIFVIAADGSGLKALTPSDCQTDASPAWSPDGKQIVYIGYSAVTTLSEIWVMNANGSGQRRLTTGKNVDQLGKPPWQPLPRSH